MDLKTYEKTRWQNIYRHKKNKNYVIMISKPVKTSISRIDGKKIFDKDQAIKIRDTYKPNMTANRSVDTDFDTLYIKYINDCKMIQKLAYNTLNKKQKLYNKYFKDSINKKVKKISKEFLVNFIDKLQTTTKQKNNIIKELRVFFNWCVKEDIILFSPMTNIKYYKVPRPEMKYWTPEELKTFLSTLNEDIYNEINIEIAYRVKILTLIGFSLGDRIGETRALKFNNFNNKSNTVKISHSINYDTKSNDFFSNTKTQHSQREIFVTEKLIEEIESYKYFLKYDLGYDVNDDSVIFFNYSTNKPYSDTNLRKYFKYYCEKAGVTKIRMYDLRHTYVATMMGEGKELYHVSKRIGHNNYNTTINKYGHLSDNVKQEIAETTDKYI